VITRKEKKGRKKEEITFPLPLHFKETSLAKARILDVNEQHLPPQIHQPFFKRFFSEHYFL